MAAQGWGREVQRGAAQAGRAAEQRAPATAARAGSGPAAAGPAVKRLRPAAMEIISVWTGSNARVRAEARAPLHRTEPLRGRTRGCERRRRHGRTAVVYRSSDGDARRTSTHKLCGGQVAICNLCPTSSRNLFGMHMIPQPEKTCHFPGPIILKNRHFARCWGEFFFFLKKTLRVSPAYSKEHGRDRDKGARARAGGPGLGGYRTVAFLGISRSTQTPVEVRQM